jgi:hypothetical protein
MKDQWTSTLGIDGITENKIQQLTNKCGFKTLDTKALSLQGSKREERELRRGPAHLWAQMSFSRHQMSIDQHTCGRYPRPGKE